MLQRSELCRGGGTNYARWPRRWDQGCGYVAGGRVLLLGRVLQDEGLPEPDPAHSKLRNLVVMLKAGE